MTACLTEKEFSRHLNTKFQLKLNDQEKIELELVEVKAYLRQDNEQTGMERFSVYFAGPGARLPQQTYSLEHEEMGQFEIFLVPISGDQDGFRYEAVFNYFKNDQELRAKS